jgi:hypothetical protein
VEDRKCGEGIWCKCGSEGGRVDESWDQDGVLRGLPSYHMHGWGQPFKQDAK